MKNFIEIKKTLANNWFKFLQEKIVDEFQLLEKKFSKKKVKNLLKESGIKKIKKKVVEFLIC